MDEYKFEITDFIPVVGIFNYIDRNKGGAYFLKSNLAPKTEPLEFISKYYIRKTGLLIYNVALGTGLVACL